MVAKKPGKKTASSSDPVLHRILPSSSRPSTRVGLATKASGRVGQKGELFPPKQVREEAGLRPGDVVVYTADHGRLEVLKVPGLREAYSRRKTAKITSEEFEKMTQETLGQ
jgi:bifunctional DNA-binding transcriptional regulator/antitoxin component of YhaV-PrlF toxin-antitoxin module